MSGFVVVLDEKEPGVVGYPTIPEAEQMMRGIAQAAAEMSGGNPPVSTRMYLSGGDKVLGFTKDPQGAQIFPSEQAAQAAIDQIPPMVRPSGFSVKPVG